MSEYTLTTFAQKKVTVTSSSQGLLDFEFTEAEINRAEGIVFAVEDQPVRYRDDGEDADADGERVVAGRKVALADNRTIQKLRWIRAGGSDATMTIRLGARFS